ncbi:hypothetical protein RQX91_04375, partial [Streptococcus pneumoniae]|nr:hypothetical protein [Streptococcus pneumoniae]MDT5548996.1 hypothetical protein [Streptococcus pneumoniae]
HQKRKDEFCPFSSLADFNPLQLTKSLYFTRLAKLFLKSTFSVGLKSTLSPLVVDELKMIPAICIQSNLYIDP